MVRGLKYLIGLTRISLIHSELETLFTLQVIWEIFPLHKNRNAYTFIVYSVLYILNSVPGSQLKAGGTDSLWAVRNGPWPAVMSVPREIVGLMAVVRRNDLDNVYYCRVFSGSFTSHELLKCPSYLFQWQSGLPKSIPMHPSLTKKNTKGATSISEKTKNKGFFWTVKMSFWAFKQFLW